MLVTPYKIQVPVGTPISFHADAWDGLGGTSIISPIWSATSGSIDRAGTFKSANPGSYTISASTDTLSAAASVSVISTNQIPVLFISTSANAAYLIQYQGLPGSSFRIEIADSLVNSTWQTLTTNTADQFGLFQVPDTPSATVSGRYYRAVSP